MKRTPREKTANPRNAEPGGSESVASLGWREKIILALFALIAILYRGYTFGLSDQAFYLPCLYHWNDPSLYPNDYLLSIFSSRQNLTWPTLALLGRYVPYQGLFFAIYAAAEYLGLLLVNRLAVLLWNRASAGLWAAFLWIPVYSVPIVAFNTRDNYLTARMLGTLLGLWALLLVMRFSPVRSALVLCCGVFVHLVAVLGAAFGLGAAHLVARRWKSLAWLVACVLASVFLFSLYMRGGGAAPSLTMRYDQSWYELLKVLVAEQFPETQALSVWARAAMLASAVTGLLWLSPRIGAERERARTLFCVALGIVILAGAGAVGTGVFHAFVAQQLCLFRGFFYLLCFACLALSGWIDRLILAGSWPAVLAGAWAAGAWMTDSTRAQALAVLLILAAHFGPSIKVRIKDGLRWLGFSRARQLGLVLLVLLLAAGDQAVFYATSFDALGWIGQDLVPFDTPVQKATLFALLFLAAWSLSRRRTPLRLVTHGLVAFGAVCVISPPAPLLDHLAQRPSTRRWADAPVLRHLYQNSRRTIRDYTRTYDEIDESRRLAARVRELVPRDAVVIVPPSWESFRERSRRSPFILFKDRGPSVSSEPFTEFLIGRMREVKAWRGPVTFDIDDTIPLEAGEVLDLARKHSDIRVEYIVTPGAYPFPMLAQEGRFRLYRIPVGEP